MSIEEMMKKLPEELQREVMEFVQFLSSHVSQALLGKASFEA